MKLLPVLATQEHKRQWHSLAALPIMRRSRHSHSSMMSCHNSSAFWIFLV